MTHTTREGKGENKSLFSGCVPLPSLTSVARRPPIGALQLELCPENKEEPTTGIDSFLMSSRGFSETGSVPLPSIPEEQRC